MTDLEAPPRAEPMMLPAPTPGLVGPRAPLPPPPLRVPAVSPPELPPLAGAPVVPPMPRFSLDEYDESDDEPTPSIAAFAEPVDRVDDLVAHGGAEQTTAVDDATDDSDLVCPPIIEAARGIALDDAGDEPSAGSSTDTTVVDLIPGASPSEPLGNPPAVEMVMPTLPSVVAKPPPSESDGGPGSHQPSQQGVPMASLADAMKSPAKKAAPNERNFARSVVRTLFAIIVVGVLGAGAHLGYDWWEQRDTAALGGVAVDGTNLASWPEVDPPAIRYTDSVTTFRDANGERTLTAHREISTGRTQATVHTTDAVGTDLGTVEIDYRGEQSFIRTSPDGPWVPTSEADALAQIGDTWTADVFTVRDVFPAAAVPYMTVLESVERVLPVRPFAPAADPNIPVVTPIATSTDPTSMVWQYRVIIDVESFRVNETVAHQEWSRQLGRSAVSRIEAWVDATGIVRQIAVDVDGTVVTHTVIGGAANSTRFDANPLLATEPAPPGDAPVPVEAGG